MTRALWSNVSCGITLLWHYMACPSTSLSLSIHFPVFPLSLNQKSFFLWASCFLCKKISKG